MLVLQAMLFVVCLYLCQVLVSTSVCQVDRCHKHVKHYKPSLESTCIFKAHCPLSCKQPITLASSATLFTILDIMSSGHAALLMTTCIQHGLAEALRHSANLTVLFVAALECDLMVQIC